MCCYLDGNQLFGIFTDLNFSIDDIGKAWEHQFRIRVFVVDDEYASVARSIDRKEANIVIVVPKLPHLRLPGLAMRIEFR
ncbi:hypothetical protein D3C87_2032280 [compost metagenome]